MRQPTLPTHTNPIQHSGFTLVELILVTAILGIMSTFTVTTFERNKNEEKLKLASKTVVQFLQAAQTRSQQELQPCQVLIDHSKQELTINNNTDCTGIQSVDLTTMPKGMSVKNLRICGSSNAANTTMACDATTDGSDLDAQGNIKTTTMVTFTPRGTVSSGGLLKLYSSNAKRSRCIAVIAPIGTIREGRNTNNNCDFNSF